MIEWADQKTVTERQITEAREAGDQDMLASLTTWMTEMSRDVHHCELCGTEYLFESEDWDDDDIDLSYSSCCNEPFHSGPHSEQCDYADRCWNSNPVAAASSAAPQAR